MDKNAQRNLASLLYKSLPAGPPPPKPPRTFKYVPRSHFEETPDGSECDDDSPSLSPTFKVLEQKKFCRFSLPTVGKYWKHKISKNKDSQLSYDYDSSPPPQSPVNLQDNTKTKLPVARQPSFKFYQRIRSFIPKKDTLLEDKQDDIEKNLRGLLEKPDDEKTAEEIREEKRLMALRIEIVRLKNELVYREENKRLKDQ